MKKKADHIRGGKLRIGAIVTVPSGGQDEICGTKRSPASADEFQPLGGIPFACFEVLGETLLNRSLDRLKAVGVKNPRVLHEDAGSTNFFPSRAPSVGKFFTIWERAVAQQLDNKAEVLILIRLGAYLELDFRELLDVHLQTSSALTQVYDSKSAFEVAVVDADQLRGEKGSYRARLSALIPYHRRYNFTGYSNRLREPHDFRQLAKDALAKRNSITPVGQEIRPGVWVGEGVSIDRTARISSPAFIGAYTKVREGCVIKASTLIERDCEVDAGTIVSDSCVQSGTYLGAGLNFAHSIIAANKLFHLDRNVEVEIGDRKLVGKRRSLRTLPKRIGEKRFFAKHGRKGTVAEPQLLQPSAANYHISPNKTETLSL